MLYCSFFTLIVISGHFGLKVAFKACFNAMIAFISRHYAQRMGSENSWPCKLVFFSSIKLFLVVLEAAEVPGPGPAAGPLLAGSSTCRWTSSSQTCGIKDLPQLYQAADSRQK